MNRVIPSDINDYDRYKAACLYNTALGWAVHPLNPPDRGDYHERGKKPVLKGWRRHRAADIDTDFLRKYFSPESTHNIGCVVRAPFVHIDLDSKLDAGESVRMWLSAQADLAKVPRERTGGGAHLVFVCNDIPDKVLKSKRAPTAAINEEVNAELYVDGLNIALSPSVHKNGHTYTWEITGEIPEVKWSDLCLWFGFSTPEVKRRGRPPKERPWWAEWKEDLRTLDLVAVMREIKCLGPCLDPDSSKWAVKCPWSDDHADAKKGAPGSDTAIFNALETMPGFACLHAHCEKRTIRDLIEWCEQQRPGIIGKHCSGTRVWKPGSKTKAGRIKIALPSIGRSQSEFAEELGNAIAPALDLFRFSQNVTEIRTVPAADSSGAIPGHMIYALKPADFVTAVERTVETGVLRADEAGDLVFMPKSMTEADARITLVSGHFTSRLPRISRVLDVPVPTLGEDGKLIYPKRGYDARFGTWLNPNSPQIVPMKLGDAIGWLSNELFAAPEDGGFWWHGAQSRIHALARLVTPFCRGLMGWKRSPLWIFDGNREGCGKDTCADVTHMVYAGRSIICAPLSKDCDEEMRKRITSALLSGARFAHFANMKGHINYSSLEAATDNSGVWEDRRLGVSETLVLPNETEFSFSANNATWEPDIERRCRRIRLCFTPEDINGHRYRYPSLLSWVRDHRSKVLSAIASLVGHWVKSGCPEGPTPFTSFPEWGRVVGGVLASCSLPDPCLPHEDTHLSGDQDTRAMRQFFAGALAHFGPNTIKKPDFQEYIREAVEVHDLFDWIDFAVQRGLITFGKLINKFDGRELGGIQLRVERTSKNYCKYRFLQITDTAPKTFPKDPSSPTSHPPTSTTPAQKCGKREELGSSSLTLIGEEKCDTKTENKNTLQGYYKSDRENLPIHPISHRTTYCTSRTDLDRIAADLIGTDRVALDIETYGSQRGDALDPWKGEIRLLTLSRSGGSLWTLDLMSVGYDLGSLAPVLEEATIIAHNAKFDLSWLRLKCALNPRKVFCSLTAARLLAAGLKPGNTLDDCLKRYLGVPPGENHGRSDWGATHLTEGQLTYAARDVVHLHELAAVMESEVKKSGLEDVWALESALLPCVLDMEGAGIALQDGRLKSIRDAARTDADDIRDQLRETAGAPSLNPSSPAQILAALRENGIRLDSTKEEILKAANDGKIIPLILAYRKAEKRAQQAKSLLAHVRHDGRIHARFEPTGTATGRFSSKEPNLQNVGRGELREAFTAPPGRRLVVADYSQIELRAAAAIAGERKMIESYKAGEDLHRKTAAAVLCLERDEVTKSDRQLAKAVNFGLLYGQSAPGLMRYAASSYGVSLSEGQAQEIRKAFFHTYTKLRQWHARCRQDADYGEKEARTRLGRRRLIPGNASSWERFTARVNMPVQGGTADGMKKAIILVAQRIPEGAHLVATVHDELVVECREEDAEAVKKIATDSMTEAMAELFPEVPIEVEANICSNWGEK